MKKSHIFLVFTFLLLIPYICSLIIIGIGYNALVLHASSIWRLGVGAIVGALIMSAIKMTIQRPLDLVARDVKAGIFKQFLRFFSTRRRPLLEFANIILDFILCIVAMLLVRRFLPLSLIVGTSIGYVLIIMFLSTCLGAYIEYDNLSIDPQQR